MKTPTTSEKRISLGDITLKYFDFKVCKSEICNNSDEVGDLAEPNYYQVFYWHRLLRCARKDGHALYLTFAVQPTISLPAKNCAISCAAVSGASEP